MKTDPYEPAYPYVYEQWNTDGSSAQFNSVVGLTKRELFAMHMPRIDDDCSPNYAGELVGIAPPTMDSPRHEWPEFWRRANARYRVMQADALIEALNELAP